jgi:hypothetical protein
VAVGQGALEELVMNGLSAPSGLQCRSCGSRRLASACNLGASPFANALVKPEDLGRMEPHYPLHALVCLDCWLMQLQAFQTPDEIFGDYAYFSSFSDSWLRHARTYAQAARERLSLGRGSLVVEIASNDGYLLQYFLEAGVPVLGVEPAANVAQAALAKGVPTRVAFFGSRLAQELRADGLRPDLIVANNVLAHTPELNDFVEGVRILLADEGLATFEFPHLQRLIEGGQFDTIYHEHFCYFSLLALEPVFARHGLEIADVEELPTHGGSLRLHVRHAGKVQASSSVTALREREIAIGLGRIETYAAFQERARETKRSLLEFLIEQKRAGRSIVGYGAAAKGATLLNYCGIGTDFIDYVVDKSPHKQGRYVPGVRIPIVAPEMIAKTRPDHILILPWNLKDEVIGQLGEVRGWGGRFVTPIPKVEVAA